MSGRITAISPQKRNRQRYNVFIDSSYAFSLSEKLAASLNIGDRLKTEDIERLKTEDEQEYAFSRALHYLKFRPRSRQEIRQYLEKKEISPPGIEKAVKKLENYSYIDDAEFARAWIESRKRHRPRGEFALRHELKQKGVSENIIDRMLDGYQEAEHAWKAVSPKLEHWAGLGQLELKKKIYDYLSRRGFSFETCEEMFRKAINTIRTEPSG